MSHQGNRTGHKSEKTINEDFQENVHKASSKQTPLSSSIDDYYGTNSTKKLSEENNTKGQKTMADFKEQRPPTIKENQNEIHPKKKLKARKGESVQTNSSQYGDSKDQDLYSKIPTDENMKEPDFNNRGVDLKEKETQDLRNKDSNARSVDLGDVAGDYKHVSPDYKYEKFDKKDESTQISNSYGSKIQAVYEDLKHDVTDTKDKIEHSKLFTDTKKSIGDVKDIASHKLSDAIETVEEKYQKSKEAIPEMYGSVKKSAQKLSQNVTEKINEVKNSESVHKIEEKVIHIAHDAKDIALTAGERIGNAIKVISDTISDILFIPPDSNETITKDEVAGEFEPLTGDFTATKDVNINQQNVENDYKVFENNGLTIKNPIFKAARNYTGDKEDSEGVIQEEKDEINGYTEVIGKLKDDHHPQVKTEDIKLADLERPNL
jgi:hypothetical protein